MPPHCAVRALLEGQGIVLAARSSMLTYPAPLRVRVNSASLRKPCCACEPRATILGDPWAATDGTPHPLE